MSANNGEQRGGIIVAVVPGQPTTVIEHAAALADDLDVHLVCANVDVNRYLVSSYVDGSVVALPYDPDLPEVEKATFDAELAANIRAVLEPKGVRYSLEQLAGDPAWALTRLADQIDARYIVVGTREAGFRGSLREFFNGSVAVHLAHRQHRPVIVVPLAPLTKGEKLPWE
ncbi:universal stress protein [Diaminobutyricibacter tongyongensis]|uniref:Universal stress protein n=1 Tax=Leifsonia tongyongensis TaxID=1268043 RepID=A0A6L9XW38_9MICO|nr:universal stress protein [Diaminobutyricibacter tongyongensis]NEN05506.1 universal stress protein [Diaminobutyricibacter tongyongensis]